MIIADVMDYREAARRRLPRFLFDYVDGGAVSETTLARNAADFAAIDLRQRVMTGVGEVNLATDLFGERWSMPVGLAPIGLAGMLARRGEVQGAAAARAANVPFCLSTMSVCDMEEVKASGSSFWFQLYLTHDRGFMRELLARAKAVGCRTLIFTTDLTVPGIRYRDHRSGLSAGGALSRRVQRVLQAAVRPRWSWDVGINGRPHVLGHVTALVKKGAGIDEFWSWLSRNFDASATWKEITAVRDLWDGPLIVKGLLDPADVDMAFSVGADGIVVSNHGGRQLDGAPSSIRLLPAMVQAVAGRGTVLLDGGIRTGTDVLRALALGADGVLVGRPWAWALGARGQAGVAHMLSVIEKELRVAMALTGVARVGDIDRGVLV